MEKQNSDNATHLRNVKAWLYKYSKRAGTYRSMERPRNKEIVVIQIFRHSKGNRKAEAREGYRISAPKPTVE
jgi:hypothetical protein